MTANGIPAGAPAAGQIVLTGLSACVVAVAATLCWAVHRLRKIRL